MFTHNIIANISYRFSRVSFGTTCGISDELLYENKIVHILFSEYQEFYIEQHSILWHSIVWRPSYVVYLLFEVSYAIHYREYQ